MGPMMVDKQPCYSGNNVSLLLRSLVGSKRPKEFGPCWEGSFFECFGLIGTTRSSTIAIGLTLWLGRWFGKLWQTMLK